MKTKIAVLALIAVTAGVFTYKQTKHIPPSDLRDAVADATESKDFDTSIPDLKSENTDKAKMELPVVKSASYDFGDRSFPIRCTTQGDALSEVIITENSRGSIIRVVGMDGKSEIYYVDAFLFSALAHAAIRPDVDAIGSKKGANRYGGAIDKSALIVLRGRPHDASGTLAANGVVYELSCKAK